MAKKIYQIKNIFVNSIIYWRSSGYDGLDLRCFEVINTPHKNLEDDNVEAVKLDYCDQQLQ